MIIELQSKETNLVSGGRFLPGLTKRLNNWVGKPLEAVGKAIKKPFTDVHVNVNHDKDGWNYGGGAKVVGNVEVPNVVAPVPAPAQV